MKQIRHGCRRDKESNHKHQYIYKYIYIYIYIRITRCWAHLKYTSSANNLGKTTLTSSCRPLPVWSSSSVLCPSVQLCPLLSFSVRPSVRPSSSVLCPYVTSYPPRRHRRRPLSARPSRRPSKSSSSILCPSVLASVRRRPSHHRRVAYIC